MIARMEAGSGPEMTGLLPQAAAAGQAFAARNRQAG